MIHFIPKVVLKISPPQAQYKPIKQLKLTFHDQCQAEVSQSSLEPLWVLLLLELKHFALILNDVFESFVDSLSCVN